MNDLDTLHCGRKWLYGWPRARAPKCFAHNFWKLWLTVTKLCVLFLLRFGHGSVSERQWAKPGPWFMTSLLMAWQIAPKMYYKYFAIMTHFGQRSGNTLGISWHLGCVLGRRSGFIIVRINHIHHLAGYYFTCLPMIAALNESPAMGSSTGEVGGGGYMHTHTHIYI